MIRARAAIFLAVCALFPIYAGAHPGCGIVVDQQGQVYFVHGGPTRSRIWRIDRAGKLTVFLDHLESKGMPNPHHLVLDWTGNLYSVGDRGGPVWKIAPDSKMTQVYPPPDWYGINFIGFGGDPFTIDSRGNLYGVNDRQFKHVQILRIGPDGRIASLAGGDWGYADGKGEKAKFGILHSGCFAWGSDGSLYVTDNGTCVRKIAPDGTVTTIAGGSAEGLADGPAREAKFQLAMGLAIDRRGNIYVADAENHRIRKIGLDGRVTTIAGSGKPGSQDGPALQATFEEPSGVAVGPEGVVYVLDWHRETPRVRKISSDGKVTTIATAKE